MNRMEAMLLRLLPLIPTESQETLLGHPGTTAAAVAPITPGVVDPRFSTSTAVDAHRNSLVLPK
jgi:hypothetical protein